MLNRKSVVLLGVLANSIGFAGTMGPVCAPGNVTVPCESTMWDLGVQALYLNRVTSAAQAYRVVYSTPTTTVHHDLEDWDWGYRIEGSYHFNTGNDVTINWTHFDDYILRDGLIGTFPLAVGDQSFSQNNTSNFDQVNLVLGQHADFGLVKDMRFYGGIQYAAIELNSNNGFYNSYNLPIVLNPFITVPASGRQFDNTQFRGVGPVWGIDYAYNFTNSWSVTATGEGSVLFGHSKYNNGYLAIPAGSGGLVLASIYGSKNIIVPSLEAKLGVNYAHAMPQGTLNVQGGYQALNYFNAVQGQYTGAVVGVRSSDYGLYGPYFGVNYVGHA